jgi:hypothetical protein
MDVLEMDWGGVDWIGLVQDRDDWRALVNAVLNQMEYFDPYVQMNISIYRRYSKTDTNNGTQQLLPSKVTQNINSLITPRQNKHKNLTQPLPLKKTILTKSANSSIVRPNKNNKQSHNKQRGQQENWNTFT